MLEFNPKRSSRLICVMSEWRNKIATEINEEKEKFIFSFLLRDPSDNCLHMCVDPETLIKVDKLKELIKNDKSSIMSVLEKCFRENNKYKNNNKFQALKDDILNNSEEDFITPLLSLLHEFPYPLTESNASDGENPKFTCIDDSLYYLEEVKGNKIEDNLIDIGLKTLNSSVAFQIPKIKFYENKLLIQNATENANEYVNIITSIREKMDSQEVFGLWIPIRTGKEFKKGRILGFVNFTCNTENFKNRVKEYLQKKLELIHFQLNTAFFEGTLFEIEEEAKELADTNLLEKTTKLRERILFTPNDRCEKKDINVCYDDIPYEYKKEQNSSILEFENGLPVDCSCDCIGENNCTNDCKTYQRSKILELIIKLVQKKDQELSIRKEAIKHGTRTAIAAIMSREDSHNIGSHVLASLNQNEIRNRPRDVEKLMNYIQQRWDFIAGIIPGYPSWSEPLFFFSDILNGFFEQGLLLDYLIKDDGVDGSDIEFCINTKHDKYIFTRSLFVSLKKDSNKKEIIHENNKDTLKGLIDVKNLNSVSELLRNGYEIEEYEYKYVEKENKDIKDFLVDIPGGVIGCHAFYCILENIMRNAAKYSYPKKTDKLFELFIDIENDGDSKDSNLFSIKISDNYSKENDHFKIANIQGKLEKDLVDCKGVIVSKDWGIQVIKLGTKYLRSPCDEDTITVDAITKEKEDGKYLAYKFEIRKPQLVTVADFNSCVSEEKQTKGIKIKRVKNNNDLESLIKDFFPQLLIVLPKKDKNKINEILNYLAKNNLKFPARILLCGSNKEHAKQIKEVLCTLKKANIIPKRRCFVGIWRKPSFPEGWEEQFIIRAYKEWVWSFGKIKDHVNIVVYFDRVKGHKCFVSWEKLNDKTLKEFELENSIKLSINGKDNDNNVIKIVGKEYDKNAKNIIVFDNHGKLGLKDVCRRYHSIGSDTRSGFNNRCIFDTLANVSLGFSGVFALLLLIESAIAKVLVIDERVAKSLVMEIQQSDNEKYIQPNNRLDSLQASGCFVPFFLRWPDKSKCLIKEYGEEIRRIAVDTTKQEGLWFDDNGLKTKILKDKKISEVDFVDFVVIHQSIFETFLKDVVDINTFTNLCKNISPRVIITSGRGNTDNKNKETNNLPFLEFSVLQRFIIQEFSKYQICRILFSVK